VATRHFVSWSATGKAQLGASKYFFNLLFFHF
jgi:hypothetical protein